jgi:hypothetical protein
MFKRILPLSISLMVFNAFAFNVSARANVRQETQAAKIEKVKEGVRKLGIGPEARVEAKLVDGRKFKGYIKDSSDENFVVVDKKSRAEITVDYSQVREIKGRNGLTAAKVAINVGKAALIVAGVAAAFTLLLFIVVPKT